ncbi:hypothetical protein AOG54_06170 [Acidiplasma aeolicum]|uniref:Uncharacterized protein n=1 Tax=Acidiplasma aeolicum TaxID=507754 RepID=A0A0N8VKJ5_9ARCH|nr:hypothetical protein AOG54_06170 [Acidiplasma aeolicum]
MHLLHQYYNHITEVKAFLLPLFFYRVAPYRYIFEIDIIIFLAYAYGSFKLNMDYMWFKFLIK